MSLFLTALVLVAAIGYLAQTTGLCLVRGVGEAASGKPLFLMAVLLSGTFAWVSMYASQFYGLKTPFISHELGAASVLGGLLFGAGAALNNGCGVSTISKLTKGQLAMVATICGWLLGWLLEVAFFPSTQVPVFEIIPNLHFGVLIALSLSVMVFVTRLDSENRKIWVSMMGIGLMAGVVFLFEPKWTPSGFLKDISFAIANNSPDNWPAIERSALIGALLGGMITAAIFGSAFRLELVNLKVILRHLFAGTLMGTGAAIAGGGNDSQLLLGLPSLSPAGIATVASMVLGIYLVKRFLSSI